LRVIRELLAFEPCGRGTNIAAALEHLNRAMRRKAVVFLISDFLDFASRYDTPLRIATRRHDLILVNVADQREFTIPPVGLLELLDNETERRLVVDTRSARWRKRYAHMIAKAHAERERFLRQSRIDCIHIRTGQPYVDDLIKFFRKREVRR